MKKAVEVVTLMLMGLMVMSALFMAAKASADTFNVLLTDTKVWDCDLPTTREPLKPGEAGLTITPEEIASIQYYIGPSVDPAAEPYQEKALSDSDRTCRAVVNFVGMGLGDHVIWARVTDTEGRQSKPSEPVPFSLVRDPGLPLAPTGGHFVDTASPVQ